MNRSSFLGAIPPVCKNIIAINLIFFLADIVLPGFLLRWDVDFHLSDVLGMHYWESPKFNVAQLITYSFMHAGFFHIFFNMLALFMFGGMLEQVFGAKRFLFYYLVTAIGAAFLQQMVWTIEYHPALVEINRQISLNGSDAQMLMEQKRLFLANPNFITVGASGSVFGLLLAFGWLFPECRIYIYFIPVKARLGVILFGAIELLLGVSNFSFDNVAHFAHLGGMLFGVFIILYWKKKRIL